MNNHLWRSYNFPGISFSKISNVHNKKIKITKCYKNVIIIFYVRHRWRPRSNYIHSKNLNNLEKISLFSTKKDELSAIQQIISTKQESNWNTLMLNNFFSSFYLMSLKSFENIDFRTSNSSSLLSLSSSSSFSSSFMLLKKNIQKFS